MDKVILAYSGGLDTSVAINWLNENYNLEVICVTVDVGNERDFESIQEKALQDRRGQSVRPRREG